MPRAFRGSFLVVLITLFTLDVSPAADVILNEYNAVGNSGPIEDGDTVFMHIDGNGGNWFELLVINDVDMRGWTLNWVEDEEAANGDPQSTGTILLSDASLWSNVERGTMLTFIETADAGGQGIDTSTDVSFDPANGDWTMNFSTVNKQGDLVTTTTNDGADGEFSVGNDNWTLTILNAKGELVFGPVGEGARSENGDEIWPGGGVSSSEAGSLEGPGRGASLECWQSITNQSTFYDDTDSTSFGQANVDFLSTKMYRTSQDLSALRGGTPEGLGDFDSSFAFDLPDILALGEQVASQRHEICFDLTGDRLVDVDDLEELVVNRVGSFMGDSDLDGNVDAEDFAIWETSIFTEGTDWTTGDFNGDGVTDVRDFNIWNSHRTDLAPVGVPEPYGLVLALLAFGGLCQRRY